MQRYATAVFFAAFAAGVLICRWAADAVWALSAAGAAGTAFFLYFFKGKKGLSSGAPVIVALTLSVFFAGGWRGGIHFSRLEAVLDALPWYCPVEYAATVSQVPPYGGRQVRYVQLDRFCAGPEGCFPPDYAVTMAVPLSDTLRVGDRISGRAVLLPLRAPLFPGEPDFRAINHRKGVVGELRNLGYRVTGRTEFSGDAVRYRVRASVQQSLVRCGVSPRAAELTLAVALGDKGAVDPATKKAYQLSGAMHLLVVSGLHVAIVAGIFFGLTFFLARSRRLRVAVVLAVLWGYGFLTGYSPPVLRALWMCSVLLLSGWGKGRYFSFGALCLAGWADLAVRPQDVYSAGFQMSYAATAAVILSYGGIRRLCRDLPAVLGFVCRLLLASLAAQTALLPFILYYFDYLNLLFPVANLLLVPVVSYGVIPLGLLLLVLSCLGIPVPPLAWAYNGLTDFCTGVASGISERDFLAVSGVELSLGGALGLGALCAALFVGRRSVKGAVGLVLLGGMVFCAVRLGGERPYPYLGKENGEYVIAVGRGRAIPLIPGRAVSVAGQTICAFPSKGAGIPRGDYILLARRYVEPARRPERIVLAPDASWRDALEWRRYAHERGVPLYDMREKGYFRCAAPPARESF